MLLDNKPYTLDRVVRMILSLTILTGLIWLLNYLSDVLIPFAAAFLLAYLINPLVAAFQKRVKKRSIAVALALLTVLITITLAASVLFPMIGREFSSMAPMLQKIATSKPPQWVTEKIPVLNWNQIVEYISQEDIQGFFKSERFQEVARNALKKIIPGVWSMITGATSFLFGLIGLSIILLYMIFLLIDYDRIKEIWPSYIPQSYRPHITGFVFEFNQAMKRYFRGQALIALLVGILFAIGLSIIGLPLGIILGLFIGLLNMVPYLQIIGMIPAILIALLYGVAIDNNPWRLPLLTLLVFAIVQTLQDTILTPRIMGKISGLSPAVILLSLAIWGKLLGLLGLLIAIPMTCLLLAYYSRFVAPPNAGENVQPEDPPPQTEEPSEQPVPQN